MQLIVKVYPSSSKGLISLHYRYPDWLTTYSLIYWHLSYILTTILLCVTFGQLRHISSPIFIFFFKLFSSIIINLKQQNCTMKNQILEAISYIKNVSKKRPTAENFLNHISNTSASDIDLVCVTETIKELIAKNTGNGNFEII